MGQGSGWSVALRRARNHGRRVNTAQCSISEVT
jgi:hypothetical protein